MASSSGGSPRSRIDQFFPSRKRRPQSKEDIKDAGKDPKIPIELSPSSKGSLEAFLVKSPRSPNASAASALGSPSIKDHVRRSLVPGTGPVSEEGSSKLGNRSSRGEEPSSVARDATHGEAVRRGPGEGEANDGGERLELRKFASDFLSLYCSEIRSPSEAENEDSSKGLKRNVSPSLLIANAKTCSKKHRGGDRGADSPEDGKASVDEGCCLESGASHVGSEAKVVMGCPEGREAVTLESGGKSIALRRCKGTANANLSKSACLTPCSTVHVFGSKQTPKSASRGSIFSPGEEFWNEAIQVADCLIDPQEKSSVQDVKASGVEIKAKPDIPPHLESGRSSSKLSGDVSLSNKMSHGDQNLPEATGVPHAFEDLVRENCVERVSRPPNKSSKSHSEASPLPVKHLDFLHEGPGFKEINAGDQSHGKQVKIDDSDNITSRNIEAQICPKSDQTNYREKVGDETPSSGILLKDKLQLSNWLPPEICVLYMKKGISKLYPWQVECLCIDGVLEKKNLVYCASTSAGKSFVAEILMLRQVISTGKMAILVLPYVSICAEKAGHLEVLLEPLGKHVRSFYGSEGGGSLAKDTSVAVCTIEKANVLVNRLLEEDRLSEVGIIVIDELHMVGDQHRGYLLELMLTKLRYASGNGALESSPGESSGSSSGKGGLPHSLQVVGMSATMPNVSSVADWLQAAFFQTNFRPVPLEEYIKVGNSILDRELNLFRTIAKNADLGGKDPDHIIELCNEVTVEGHSVLIFCSSRKGCESTARHISRLLGMHSVDYDCDDEFTVSSAIETLKKCPAGLDPILEETIPSGVAYHHAGLTVEEREIVETLYRKGLVRVLTATSTLAAGVNLPARRVIFRQPRIGRDFIDGTRYRQMAGRAGRTGIDTKGESVIICKKEELKKISALLNDGCPPLESCLSDDKNGMTHAILEVVAGGIVLTANDIHRYVRCTLLNSTRPFEDVVKSAQDSLRWLCHNKFVEWNADSSLYSTTPLGRACFGSSLSPEESLIVLDDLLRAREGLVLASDLHMVYLVTPINIEIEPDWELFYERFMGLSALEQSVGNRVGVVEPFLMRMAHGAPTNIPRNPRGKKSLHGKCQSKGVTTGYNSSDNQILRVSKRFYVALMLSKLVQEVPVSDVCDSFRVARGMIQSLQENAGRFASMVSLFCERLGWQDLGDVIAKFQNRVSFGVRAEIVELTVIPYVKGSRARALYKAGLRTPLAIAESPVPEIARALFERSSWAAEDSSAMQKMQLGVAKKIKNGARRIVLEKAEEARVAAFSAFQSLGVRVPDFSVVLPSSADAASNKHDDILLSPDNVEMLHSKSKEVKVDIGFSAMETISDRGGEGSSYIGQKVETSCVLELVEKSSSDEVARNLKVSVPDLFPAASSVSLVSSTSTIGIGDKNGNVTLSLPTELTREGKKQNSNGMLGNDQGGFSSQVGDGVLGSGPVGAGRVPGGIDSFLEQWETVGEFFFDAHFIKRNACNSPVFEIFGLAICWKDSPIYYIDLPKDLKSSRKLLRGNSDSKSETAFQANMGNVAAQRWDRIVAIMGKSGVRKITWNLKTQIQVLKSSGISIQRTGGMKNEMTGFSDFKLVDSTHKLLPSVSVQGGFDVCLLLWVLWPDEENCSSLDKVVKKHLSPDAVAAANHDGRWKNQMRKAALDGCCRRVAQTRALFCALWSLLVSESLLEVLTRIENPLVSVLADMEHWGVGVDLEGCLHARRILGKRLKELEMEALKLAGIPFSLYSTVDIANVLYVHLKLPRPEGSNKGKHHPSTDKHSLELLRDQHPIIPVIKEHRMLSKLFNTTLGSICSKAQLCKKSQKYIIKGHWLQTSAATGRLSMEDPNLQCVEHSVDFALHNYVECDPGSLDVTYHQINARDFFIPTQDNWVLLMADYSQIELRLMAHFSKDSLLIDILSRPDGDVFIMMAARWTKKLDREITSEEREQTKRLVYGILYGMGANTLAEQLECNLEEARNKIQSFKASFPGVSAWLQEAVESCRQKGYIETLMGRKRFLSKIKIGTGKEKAKAERQAVNSICQGSAADVIKIAMMRIYSVVSDDFKVTESFGIDKYSGPECPILKGRCHLLLQVHDELLMEVDPVLVKEAGSLLRNCMETAASLLVPLRVKLMVGRSWGSLETFELNS